MKAFVCFRLERSSVTGSWLNCPGSVSAAALWRGRTLYVRLFLKMSLKTSSRGLASRVSCAIKAAELLTLLCMIDAAVLDTFFFNTSPPPPSYLPHLESIKELWEEGENLTSNVFTMPGKTSETTFIRLGPLFVRKLINQSSLALPKLFFFSPSVQL